MRGGDAHDSRARAADAHAARQTPTQPRGNREEKQRYILLRCLSSSTSVSRARATRREAQRCMHCLCSPGADSGSGAGSSVTETVESCVVTTGGSITTAGSAGAAGSGTAGSGAAGSGTASEMSTAAAGAAMCSGEAAGEELGCCRFCLTQGLEADAPQLSTPRGTVGQFAYIHIIVGGIFLIRTRAAARKRPSRGTLNRRSDRLLRSKSR